MTGCRRCRPTPRSCPGPTAPATPETLLKERDRLAEDLRRERERTRDKDRKLREEREAHAATRSELTSDRDKLKNALRELERQLASGPSSETIAAALAGRDEAESAAQEARRELREAAARATAAESATRRAEAALEGARADVDAARAEAERLRAAPPSTTDLVRAARHVGAAALLRLEAPGAGDAELLEVIAAITRWQAAAAGATRRSARGQPPAPEPPPPAEPSGEAAQPRTRSSRARAAARAIGGPIRITIAGGGGIGSSAYVLEYGGARILLDCGIGGAGMYGALPEQLDAAVLTHAHGDHMGGLPELLRRQPDLRVYCSKSTKLLATYQANAADEYIPGDRMLVRDPGETYRILDGAVDLTLHRVAHILGSCAVRLRFADDRVVVYSGDLGGTGLRTLRPGRSAAAGRRRRGAARGDARRPRPDPRESRGEPDPRSRRDRRRRRLRRAAVRQRRPCAGAGGADRGADGGRTAARRAGADDAARPARPRPVPGGRPRRLAGRHPVSGGGDPAAGGAGGRGRGATVVRDRRRRVGAGAAQRPARVRRRPAAAVRCLLHRLLRPQRAAADDRRRVRDDRRGRHAPAHGDPVPLGLGAVARPRLAA